MAVDQNAVANEFPATNLAGAPVHPVASAPDLLLCHHADSGGGDRAVHQFSTAAVSSSGHDVSFVAWLPALHSQQQQVSPPERAPSVTSGTPSSNGRVPEEQLPSSSSCASRKLKFLCSFGGKILPRASDGALRYVGGQTRIITLRKDASFQELMRKMSEVYGGPAVLKYQLPGEDLDALVSVSCPEDLENMIEEYDKLAGALAEGSARLRVFLFSPADFDASVLAFAPNVDDTGQRYMDAVNGIAEKEVAGIKRKESVASFSSTQTSDGAPTELLETTIDGAPAIASAAVASSWVTTSHEPPVSVCSDVPSKHILSVSGVGAVPVDVLGSAGNPSAQILSSKLDQPQPLSVGTPCAPPAYNKALPDGINPVDYTQTPGHIQRLTQHHPYATAVNVTTAVRAAQMSSGKPVCASPESLLDDGPCVGRFVQVAANPIHRPSQELSLLPPLPHSLLQTHNVDRYGISHVPAPGAIPVQTLRFENCNFCQRALPHVHSDNLVQELGERAKFQEFHASNLEEMARFHVPYAMVHGSTQNSAAILQTDGSITPLQMSVYGYPQAVEFQKTVEAIPFDVESLGKTNIMQPQMPGFSIPFQTSYGVYVGDQTQGWHEGILQQQKQQLPLATSQYPLKQETWIGNAIGSDIISARNIDPQKLEIQFQESVPELLCDIIEPTEGMMSMPPLNYAQASDLNECQNPSTKTHISETALIEATMNTLHISLCDTSNIIEPTNNLKAQYDLNPDGSLLSVESMGDKKQNVVQADTFLTENCTCPGRVAELVDLLPPSSTLEISDSDNLQSAQACKVRPVTSNLGLHSQGHPLDSEPLIPHEWLLEGSKATNEDTVSSWKDKGDPGNAVTDLSTPSTGTSPASFSNMNMPVADLGDIREPGLSESLFSDLEPWQIMHSAHLLPPKPKRVASRDKLLMRDSSENLGEATPVVLLEKGNYIYDHLLDSLNKVTCSNTSTAPPVEGKTEELIKQELRDVAEGVAASVFQQFGPIPGTLPLDADSVSDSGRESEFHEHDVNSESFASHIAHDAEMTNEDTKPAQLDKSNLGFQIMEDLDHLQIIRNNDLEELRELGSGTFGTVYHGRWRGSDVAIKRINDRCFAGKLSEQERLRADFWNEASKLAVLHHPNVVSFYGVVLDGPGGSVATVTEYMVNGSLRQALQKNHKTIDRRKRILIAMDVAFGMEYLHDKNIVHFDLKSDNLLVNLRDPQRPICKVGDLGLSKVKCRTLISGGVRGTLPWMAPELLNGSNGLVSEKVDVFSFGIVMWELLTGEEPYADLHYGAIIGGIVNNTLRPPVPESCDAEWRSLMESCWRSESSERPSFTEIASKLRAMAASFPQRGQVQAQT